MLECRDLGLSYEGVPVLEEISFSMDKGQFYVLLGRNGSGKTSLIHCLNKTAEPDKGQINIMGKNLKEMSPRQIAGKISLVPQEHMDVFPFTVLDVVVMGRAPFLGFTQRPGPKDYDLAAQALAWLNAEFLGSKNFNRISGGERQIALLARALVQSSSILLLDEPCNHLDFNNQFLLLSTIKSLCRTQGLSILAAMHDPNMAALFADQVIMIQDKTIMAKGLVEDIMTPETISILYDTKISPVTLKGRGNLFFPDTIFKGKP
jgi:iron complex transport system ATP-binding protein